MNWIPIKWRAITDEERENNCFTSECDRVLVCPMPEDEEDILITVKRVDKGGARYYVEVDTCYIDSDGNFYLDDGYDWIDDVVAWMPLPEPYKENV